MPTSHTTQSQDDSWTELEVARVRGRSRLVTCRCVAPLKVFNPGHDADPCQLVFSNYGGGLVQGDVVRVRLRCREGSSTTLETQANTRVYRTDPGKECVQEVHGTLAAGARAVVLPAPVVLHAGCRFRQHQHWHVAKDATLILSDIVHPGRIDSGELFDYDHYESRLRIHSPDGLILRDDFRLDGAGSNPTKTGVMGDFRLLANIYLVGANLVANLERIEQHLSFADAEDATAGILASVNPHRDVCVIVRVLMRDHQQGQRLRDALDMLVDELVSGVEPTVAPQMAVDEACSRGR